MRDTHRGCTRSKTTATCSLENKSKDHCYTVALTDNPGSGKAIRDGHRNHNAISQEAIRRDSIHIRTGSHPNVV